MSKTNNVFTKCFLLGNKSGNFNEEDFNEFINCLKNNGALDERFENFREAVRAVKNAARDSNLKATVVNPIIKKNQGKITIVANKTESAVFNLYIILKPLSHLCMEDHYGITSVAGSKKKIEVFDQMESSVKYTIPISESMLSFENQDIGFINDNVAA